MPLWHESGGFHVGESLRDSQELQVSVSERQTYMTKQIEPTALAAGIAFM